MDIFICILICMMASKIVPTDQWKAKFYKCCPLVEVRTVICIIYENTNYKVKFYKLENTKYIDELIDIYPEHEDLNLTTNIKEEISVNLLEFLLINKEIFIRISG